MLPFTFDTASDESIEVLCLGAHCDDIEIGSGATMLRLAQTHPHAQVTWVVFSGNAVRMAEARESAEYCLRGFSNPEIQIHDFRNGFFPYVATGIKEEFEALKSKLQPQIIFTHFREDLHQDHRLIAELTWNTFRDHLILEYEIPKYDGGLGSPNLFVPLSDELVAEKLEMLDRFFESQRKRAWFSHETFAGLMRLRGMECNSNSGYAEAFYCRKAVVT